MNKEIVKEETEEKVHDWFESSGKMKEIQAKLRSELFEIVQSQLKTKQDLSLKAMPNPKPTPALSKLVNLPTNSVFVTEAEIEARISAPLECLGKSNDKKSEVISPSPTDFLTSMKPKRDGLITEDSTISDEFEELHYETSQKEQL
jgi:hypothetical protein